MTKSLDASSETVTLFICGKNSKVSGILSVERILMSFQRRDSIIHIASIDDNQSASNL